MQQAYVSAYSGGSIPFVVLNGQYVHAGSSLIDPSDLSSYEDGASGGYTAVATSVLQETGTPWSIIQGQAGWICAFILKADGYSSVSAFIAANPSLSHPNNYQWTTSMQNLVQGDLSQIT